jgi:hypothetical protein
MTKREYAQYQARYAAFMIAEKISILAADDNEPGFSWRPCDCCKTELGGDRYHATGANPGNGPNGVHYSVCGDCLYYSEYGRLDDTTIAELGA